MWHPLPKAGFRTAAGPHVVELSVSAVLLALDRRLAFRRSFLRFTDPISDPISESWLLFGAIVLRCSYCFLLLFTAFLLFLSFVPRLDHRVSCPHCLVCVETSRNRRCSPLLSVVLTISYWFLLLYYGSCLSCLDSTIVCRVRTVCRNF